LIAQNGELSHNPAFLSCGMPELCLFERLHTLTITQSYLLGRAIIKLSHGPTYLIAQNGELSHNPAFLSSGMPELCLFERLHTLTITQSYLLGRAIVKLSHGPTYLITQNGELSRSPVYLTSNG